MIVLKGDEVKLKSGDTAEVVDIWGVARTWHKLKLSNGSITYAMTDQIEAIVRRYSDKRKWGAR